MTGQGYAARCGGHGGPRGFRAAMMMRHGGGPFGGPGEQFGFSGPRGFGGPRGRGKARRGDIRTAALLLLAEEPRNGYSIMQELEQRSDGVWRPSPGSVYPALSQLEDEGLIRSQEQDGRKLFAITDAGREVLAKRPGDATAPWEALLGGVSNDVQEVFGLMRQVGVAGFQLAQTATEPQLAEAKKVLSEARKALYRILANGDDAA